MRNAFLILAALAATSCSLQLDSQYGLRWDARVTAPRDRVAQFETSSAEGERIQGELDPQIADQSAEAHSLPVPTNEFTNVLSLEPVEWSDPETQAVEIQQAEGSESVQVHPEPVVVGFDTEHVRHRSAFSNAARIAGLGFLMFLLFLTLIISALIALIAFAWWIPANDDPLITGILPLLFAIGSIIGITKVGRKIDELRREMKKETSNRA